MKYAVLASGSSGNCSLICSGNTRIIIDCGANKKYLIEKFNELGIDYLKCDGLLLTHEHTDHIKSIRMFESLDVYSPFEIRGLANEKHIEPWQTFKIGELVILPILLSHDTPITVGYIIFDGKETLVQVTDTGYLSEDNQRLIKGADYYIFESNHDEAMLMKTDRPYLTKKRILSDHGHMSNHYASEILAQSISQRTKEIVLAHISQQANDYQLAYQTLIDCLKGNGIDTHSLRIKAVQQFELYQGGHDF